MSRLRVFIAVTAIALVVPFAVMGGKPRPPVPATMQGDVDSRTATVQVGRDVVSYGPMNQKLYIDESLLPPDGAYDPTGGIALVKSVGSSDTFYGAYHGRIRVLDNRLDYYFDTSDSGCGTDNTTSRCPFHLVVADGAPIYIRFGKTKVLDRIAFVGGRTLLDYCVPGADPATCWVRLYGCYDERDCAPDQEPVRATFDVKF